MNAKKGMRRLGVLAGVLGACVGSYISYQQVRILLEQRSGHEEFQSLAASPVVQREVLFLKNNLTISQTAHDASAQDRTPARTAVPTDSPSPPSGTVWSEAPLSIYVEDHHGQGWFDAVGAIGGFNGWRIDEGGVKTIYFRNEELKAIEKENGVTITARSGLLYWSYLLAMMPSILGFLLPWASLATLTWIGTGFFKNSK